MIRSKFKSLKSLVDRLMGPGYFILKSKKLQGDKGSHSLKQLRIGLSLYPKSIRLNKEQALLLMANKDWKYAIHQWEKLIVLYESKKRKIPIDVFVKLSTCYRKVRKHGASERIIVKGLELYKNNKKLWNTYALIAIERKQWKIASERFDHLFQNCTKELSVNIYIRASMVYQIIGDVKKSNEIFQKALQKHPSKIEKDTKGYRKIILFDNGESRIEFYKKLAVTERVVVTFDSINMVWGSSPFAFKLLSRQNVDIIAVRKRKKQTYQQDLTQEDFVKTVSTVTEKYTDKVAYGFSLGAYATLYFASLINCRILSISPRLSIHPVYGRKKIIPKFEFKHNISFPYNPDITPVIVFDPKNKLDNTYIEREVIKAFPNARLIKIPYGGHGMAPHLLKMGLLKEFVLTVVNEEGVPKYNRKNKLKSSIYFRLLGDACLKRNKVHWALDLVEKSLEMLPNDKLGVKLKIKVLVRLHQVEEAIKFTEDSIELIPKVLELRLLLVDLYLESNALGKAREVVEQALEIWGEKKVLKNKLKTIDQSQSLPV